MKSKTKIISVLLCVCIAIVFLSGFAFSVDSNAKSVGVHILDSVVNYEYGGEVYNAQITNSNGSYDIQKSDLNKTALDFDGFLTLNLSNVSSEDLKKIESYLKENKFEFKFDASMANGTAISCDEFNYTLNGGMLNITFDTSADIWNEYVNQSSESPGTTTIEGCQLWSNDFIVNA